MERLLRRAMLVLIGFFSIGTLAVLVTLTAFWYKGLFEVMPRIKAASETYPEASIVLSADGVRLKRYCLSCRERIPLAVMGHFPRVAVALEDNGYWGDKPWNVYRKALPIDVGGTGKAILDKLKHGGRLRGGSGIELQTTRTLFLKRISAIEQKTKSKVIGHIRKANEIWFSFWLRTLFTKEQILELYLNNIYSGWNQHGIMAASEWYFGKTPQELTLEETVQVASVWRSPSANPFQNQNEFRRVYKRALGQMVREGLMNQQAAQLAGEMPFPKRKSMVACKAEHPLSEVFMRAQKVARVNDAGLRIEATIDCGLQGVAVDALSSAIAELKGRHPNIDDFRAAAMFMHAETGEVFALAQYPSFKESQYRATQIKRQLGSAAKVLFYLSWLLRGGRFSCKDEGDGPCLLNDSYGAVCLSLGRGRGGKCIQNFPYLGRTPRYIGVAEPMAMIEASRNVGTMSGMVIGDKPGTRYQLVRKEELIDLLVKLGYLPPTLALKTSVERGITFLPLGLTEKLDLPFNTIDPGHTIAIGSIEFSVEDMLRVLATIYGSPQDPRFIRKVRDYDGREIALPFQEFDLPRLRREISLQMIRGLRVTVEGSYGTAKEMAKDTDVACAGKTGTAANSDRSTTDNWFVGFCANGMIGVVWVGREYKDGMPDTRSPAGPVRETGSKNGLPVFRAMAKAYAARFGKGEFPVGTDPKEPFVMFEGDNTPFSEGMRYIEIAPYIPPGDIREEDPFKALAKLGVKQ